MDILMTAKNNIFYRFVAIALCTSMAAYLVFVRPDTAYAATVSTLPADIDCSMSYDTDNVYFTVGGQTYSFDRHMSVFDTDNVPYFANWNDIKSNLSDIAAVSDYAVGGGYNGRDAIFRVFTSGSNLSYEMIDYVMEMEQAYSGSALPVSYWFSPSQNKVYIVSSEPYNSYIPRIRSYSGGIFVFENVGSSCDAYITCFDCSSGAFVHRFDALSGSYWKKSGGYSWSNISGVPDDLICFFANYKISGFYEPDTNTVQTPSYYFNYQYIFYLKDYGYTFVDSAEQLLEVGFPGNAQTARYIFADKGNFYIYTSVDGISWSVKTTASTMYASYFDLNYNTTVAGLYDLVYTNDDDFGISIKEWVSLPDVIGDLEELQPVLDYYRSDFYIDSGYDYDKYNTVRYWSRYIEQLALRLDSNLTGGFLFDYFSGNRFDNTDNPVTYGDYFTLFLLTELSSEYIIDYNTRGGESGTLTLFGFVKRLNSLVENTNVYLDRILNQLHLDLNGVNDNLALLYDNSNNSLSYLKKLLSSVDSLPSYLADIKDSISALGDLSGPSVSGEPTVDYTELMQSIDLRLDTLNYGLFGDDVPSRPSTYAFFAAESSGVLGGFLPDLYTTLTDTTSDYFNSIDDSLNEFVKRINPGTDYSSVLDRIEGSTSSINDWLAKLYKLVDDENDISTLIDLANDVLNANYISGLLTFTNEVTNGIEFTNTVATGVYDALGPSFSRIVLLGGGFTLLAVIIKKERAS